MARVTELPTIELPDIDGWYGYDMQIIDIVEIRHRCSPISDRWVTSFRYNKVPGFLSCTCGRDVPNEFIVLLKLLY